ncbi:MAG: DUF2148 domain-containing protein [Candidatus Omnitrophota bacterium]
MISEQQSKKETLKNIGLQMILAARTAPKGRGQDTFTFCLAEGKDIQKISKVMKELGQKYDAPAFLRDAENILSASVIVLLGTSIKPMGLKKCGMCGFKNCEAKPKGTPCVLNTGDLGIAIGSAVSVAADRRVDNRVMYTAGQAALELGLLGKKVKNAYAIPLSAMSKNPFF